MSEPKNICHSCGRFRRWDDLICGLQAEGPETWNECRFCCSDSDYEDYLLKRLGPRKKEKQNEQAR